MKGEILLAAGNFLCPGPGINKEVNVSVLHTGWVETNANRVTRGADKATIELPLLVGHIQHPLGDVYIDAGLGNTTREGTFPRFPLSPRNVTIPEGSTIAEQAPSTPRTVLTTHLHYDHTGGLLDLTHDTEVWTTEAEWQSVRTSNVAFPEGRMREAVTWRPVNMEAGQRNERLGRPAIDVHGDGSIWYLSTPGHTPGSASVLVHAADAAWLFIGDIAWVDEHLNGARRPQWVSLLVDGRPRAHKRALQWARSLRQQCPSLEIVAGHEPRWTE